jgi:D-amino-acid dehydrogenase
VVVEKGRAIGVRVVGGELERCDAVVLATGPISLELAGRLGTRLPVQPGKGYHRDVPIGPNGAQPLEIACVLQESSVFCTPLETCVRFAGTMEFSGANRIMRRARLEQLTQAAREVFPRLGPARPESEWCGLRPMSVDGLPIVGPLEGVEGVAVATGHGMLGLTLAPVTGKLIANHLTGRSDGGLEGLSPGRFRAGRRRGS